MELEDKADAVTMGAQCGHIHFLLRLSAVQHLNHTEPHIFISLRSVPSLVPVFGTSVRPNRGPRATLDAQRGNSALLRTNSGGPFPYIAPKIHSSVGTPGHIGIFIHRRSAVVDAAVEVGVLGHVSCCQLPLALIGETIRIRTIFLSKPCAVTHSIVIGDKIHRVVFLPCGIRSVFPV